MNDTTTSDPLRPTEDELRTLLTRGSGEFGDGEDDLFDQAVQIVTQDRRASTSYLQRRLKIGYNRAATLMERLEAEGVVSAANHAGKRDVLAPKSSVNEDVGAEA